MKFIFLKSGDYLELEPNNTPIANAWFTSIFSKKMNMSYFAKGPHCIENFNQVINELNNAVDIVNQFALSKNLPQIMFDKIKGIDQSWLNSTHKQWVKYTDELKDIVNGDDTTANDPQFVQAWGDINSHIHRLEGYYSLYFTNTKGAILDDIDIDILPEHCEYSQHDLILSFDNLGKHQHAQWVTNSKVDEETSNYKTISARFEYTFNPAAPKGLPPIPDYVDWCKKNNLKVLPPWAILGNFKKNRWDVKHLIHQNLSQGLEVGFEW